MARSLYSSYLRGRVVGAGIGDPEEADAYADEAVPLRIRVAFALGVCAKRHAPILGEADLQRAVEERIEIAKIVKDAEDDDVSTDDDDDDPPVPADTAGAAETARVASTPWIGDPMPATGC